MKHTIVNIFEVQQQLAIHGFWYCVWLHGWSNIWAIFVANRMNKYQLNQLGR